MKVYHCVCGTPHIFVPHPFKDRRMVAYCGGRSVCETWSTLEYENFADIPFIGEELAQTLREKGLLTLKALEAALSTSDGEDALLAVRGVGKRTIEKLRDYFLGTKLDLIVVGSGRCGTKFIANLLTGVGLPCEHEQVFSYDGLASARYKLNDYDLKAESSWMAVPFLDQNLFSENAILVHLVREPIKVLSSYLGMKFFAQESPFSAPHREFVYSHLPELESNPLVDERIANFYVAWNVMIEQAKFPTVIHHRVEDAPSILLDKLELDYEGKELFSDTKCNTRNSEPFDLGMLCRKSKVAIKEMSERYGYSV